MRYGSSHHTGGHWTLGTGQLVYRARRVQTLPHGPDTTQHCAPCSGSAPAADIMSPSCSPVFRHRRLSANCYCHCHMDLGLGACLWQSAVLLSPVVSLLLYCLTLPLRLATNRATPVQRGDWRQARWVRGCRGLALRMSPDRPGAVPMWQLWAGKVCQDTATITFIDHSRSNKFASVITGRLCSKAHFWHWACKHSDSAISIIMNFELKTFQIIKWKIL